VLTRRIVPCLDVRDGRVVKGVRFQSLRDMGDPADRARAYEEQGADEIVVLDVSATLESRGARLETVRAVREVLSIPLTVGGGVRRDEDAAELLEAGADKVSVNTAAVAEPELVTRLAERFGTQCTVVAIDARRQGGRFVVCTHSGSRVLDLDALDWARRVVSLGAGEILLTSFDRDGTRAGYDLELLGAAADAVTVPVIASGGADGPEHLLEGLRAGADAVLAASIFHEGTHAVSDVKRFLASSGVSVRP